jgi:ATP-dependent 26S proteasome regulatory subunit
MNLMHHFSGDMSQVFKAAAALGGAIIFIDELDALGGSRCVIHGMDKLVDGRFRI